MWFFLFLLLYLKGFTFKLQFDKMLDFVLNLNWIFWNFRQSNFFSINIYESEFYFFFIPFYHDADISKEREFQFWRLNAWQWKGNVEEKWKAILTGGCSLISMMVIINRPRPCWRNGAVVSVTNTVNLMTWRRNIICSI